MDNVESHTCHFCGTTVYVTNGVSLETATNERHNLSDCRPDLVEHDVGEICTWWFRRVDLVIGEGTPNERIEEALPSNRTCYAYQDSDLKWTDEHVHFYPDGPM